MRRRHLLSFVATLVVAVAPVASFMAVPGGSGRLARVVAAAASSTPSHVADSLLGIRRGDEFMVVVPDDFTTKKAWPKRRRSQSPLLVQVHLENAEDVFGVDDSSVPGSVPTTMLRFGREMEPQDIFAGQMLRAYIAEVKPNTDDGPTLILSTSRAYALGKGFGGNGNVAYSAAPISAGPDGTITVDAEGRRTHTRAAGDAAARRHRGLGDGVGDGLGDGDGKAALGGGRGRRCRSRSCPPGTGFRGGW